MEMPWGKACAAGAVSTDVTERIPPSAPQHLLHLTPSCQAGPCRVVPGTTAVSDSPEARFKLWHWEVWASPCSLQIHRNGSFTFLLLVEKGAVHFGPGAPPTVKGVRAITIRIVLMCPQCPCGCKTCRHACHTMLGISLNTLTFSQFLLSTFLL